MTEHQTVEEGRVKRPRKKSRMPVHLGFPRGKTQNLNHHNQRGIRSRFLEKVIHLPGKERWKECAARRDPRLIGKKALRASSLGEVELLEINRSDGIIKSRKKICRKSVVR